MGCVLKTFQLPGVCQLKKLGSESVGSLTPNNNDEADALLRPCSYNPGGHSRKFGSSQ
jgi:hypothetical protein